MIYGLTYVDHKTKCVFNGSDLGKHYSAKGLQERCRPNESVQSQTALKTSVKAQRAQSTFVPPEHPRSQKPVEE
jgi:hypothetical protein